MAALHLLCSCGVFISAEVQRFHLIANDFLRSIRNIFYAAQILWSSVFYCYLKPCLLWHDYLEPFFLTLSMIPLTALTRPMPAAPKASKVPAVKSNRIPGLDRVRRFPSPTPSPPASLSFLTGISRAAYFLTFFTTWPRAESLTALLLYRTLCQAAVRIGCCRTR